MVVLGLLLVSLLLLLVKSRLSCGADKNKSLVVMVFKALAFGIILYIEKTAQTAVKLNIKTAVRFFRNCIISPNNIKV
jgi:hypothetical protein